MSGKPRLPEIPHELVAEIVSFIPRVIDKYSRRECRKSINKLRHKSAKKLHEALIEYYIDDWDDLEQQKKNGYKPVDQEAVIISTQPEQIHDTLINISTCLAYASNWPEMMCDFDWNDSIMYRCRKKYLRSELWFERLCNNREYSFRRYWAINAENILPYI